MSWYADNNESGTGPTILPGGNLNGSHVPLPTRSQPIRQRTPRTGHDWSTGLSIDPDAVAREGA